MTSFCTVSEGRQSASLTVGGVSFPLEGHLQPAVHSRGIKGESVICPASQKQFSTTLRGTVTPKRSDEYLRCCYTEELELHLLGEHPAEDKYPAREGSSQDRTDFTTSTTTASVGRHFSTLYTVNLITYKKKFSVLTTSPTVLHKW